MVEGFLGSVIEQAIKEGIITYNPVKEVVINKNLAAQYAKEKAYRRLCGNGYVENDYIFKHADGTVYYPDYPTKAFSKLIKRIPELPQSITFHGLRSSCVSMLVHQGMDVKSIQKWVGHADIDTTLRIYAKVKDKESKKRYPQKRPISSRLRIIPANSMTI